MEERGRRVERRVGRRGPLPGLGITSELRIEQGDPRGRRRRGLAASSLTPSSPSGSRGCSSRRGGELAWRQGAGHNALFPTLPIICINPPRTFLYFGNIEILFSHPPTTFGGTSLRTLVYPESSSSLLVDFCPQRSSISLLAAQSHQS